MFNSEDPLTPEQAEGLLRRHISALSAQTVLLDQLAGRILRQTVWAERDLPPFDRVAMDGVAFSSTYFATGKRDLHLQGIQAAGARPLRLDGPQYCIEVMTGAVLPEGCDCVVQVEKLSMSAGIVRVADAVEITGWLNVHRRGSDGHAGDLQLRPGIKLQAAHIAIIASAGLSQAEVTREPRILVVATGDELVEPGMPIEPWQIRSCNDFAMIAALRQAGSTLVIRARLSDDPVIMRERLAGFLESHEVVVLSGSVSRGRFDHLPSVLNELGVQQVMHKIAQRPGHPFWFGHRADEKYVFALPGNPVAAQICLVRYVLPGLQILAGALPKPREYIPLAQAFSIKHALTHFVPVTLRQETGEALSALPCPTKGSGDFLSLRDSDGFVELAGGPRTVPAGKLVPIYRWP